MILEMNDINADETEICDLLEKHDYKCIKDDSSKTYVAWNIKDLMYDSSDKMIIKQNCIAISELRSKYNGNPDDIACLIYVTNKEMNNAINKLEKTLGYTINRCLDKSLFDCISAARQNFSENKKYIDLYVPTVEIDMDTPVLIIPTNLVLRLTPITLVDKTDCTEKKELDNFFIITISKETGMYGYAGYEDIIDENNNLKIPKIQPVKTHIDPNSYKVGYIYKDEDGERYIFINSAKLEIMVTSPNAQQLPGKIDTNATPVNDFPPTFIQITPQIKQKIHKYNRLQNLIRDLIANAKSLSDIANTLISDRSKIFVKEEGYYYNDNTLSKFTCIRKANGFYHDITMDFFPPN